jgi:AcrR family transcriptional regulator
MTKKNIIVETAARLFSQEGYSATPTHRIAKEAGVSEALIFRHFGTKEGLLKAIIAQGVAQIGESMMVYGAARGLDTEGGVVANHVSSAFKILRENTVFWRLAQQIRFQEAVQHVAQEPIAQVNQMILTTLTQYFQQQNAPDPMAEALLLFALIDGVTIHFLQNPTEYPLDSIESLIKSKYRNENN